MNNTPTKKDIEILYEDVDYNGLYKMSNLFTALSSIATTNSFDIEFYSKDLLDKYGFVLTKQTLVLNEPIKFTDEISIITRAYKCKTVQAFRTYEIYKGDKHIGGAYSIWALLDLQKRSVAKLSAIGADQLKIESYEPSVTKFKKITEIEVELIEKRTVRISDIDTNQHMNNARYVEWSNDLFKELNTKYYVSELSVHFLHELSYKDEVDLYLGVQDNYFYIIFKHNETECFKAGGYFKEI
ncbi:MAG: thioesterase [Thomasclavelia sp.]|nr:thioesterase [Thomasclavelia sp.]